MTDFEIQRIPFDRGAIDAWAGERALHTNWPVVYTLNDSQRIYVGETSNAHLRLTQHLSSESKRDLHQARVVFRQDFNKSACLDLESFLIRYFAADDQYEVLNGNAGITDSDYFQRDRYRESFELIFNELVRQGILTRSIPDLVNSDLFKYSPFKALTTDQAVAIEGILENLFQNIANGLPKEIVVQGDPGTGKTIVAVYLMKLLQDIKLSNPNEPSDADSLFSDFFQSGYREQLRDFNIGLVVPQISLRRTIEKVFSKTPGLSKAMVLDPFEVGESDEYFDLLIVDESHRLQQRANQPAASRNIQFQQINSKLFGSDDKTFTQLDWIKAKSLHQIYLLDESQSVKPADLPSKVIGSLVQRTKSNFCHYSLSSQMRVSGGADYIDFIGRVLHDEYDGGPKHFGDYDLKFFDNFLDMKIAIEKKASDPKTRLSRLLSGFAWPWQSKSGEFDWDIEIDGIRMPWNRRNYDWVNSPTSLDEVGSIHTIQGYDLNFAGVIIGPDLYFDQELGKIAFNRERYFDKKGKENNPTLGIFYTDDDLLNYVTNIYRVLLTRGIDGTYIYVYDKALRERLRPFFKN
jgi:uncharacterized protein